ncbi:hypothetical protein J4Q44_G00132130 [Coregonus suidteri]|uniref:Uncharacterized protein n=1 Tax=Coregonus suidteri TaxID=861788 RepID=A0AAN8LSE0_9TELE
MSSKEALEFEGAPVVASFPHFYLGEEKYSNAIEGLNPCERSPPDLPGPEPDHWYSYPLPVRRAQINILINRISGFPTVVIDDTSAAKLQKLLLMVTLVSNFPLIIVGLGAILLLVFICLVVRECKQKTTTKEDTSYSLVSNKEGEEKNGNTYIGMTPIIEKS